MRTLAVLGLLAVAFASQSWSTFKSDRLYEYKFDGQITTGLPSDASEQSMTRLQSTVSLVIVDDRNARLQLKDIRMGSANRQVEQPRDLLPWEHFDAVELNEEQKKELSLPIRFRYESGLISEIEFDREDKPWSENIKRAVLNMMQINLLKKSRSDKQEMDVLRLSEDDKETLAFNHLDAFAAREKTLEGDCQTTYTVVPLKKEEDNKVRVTKSIDFETCDGRVDIRYNYRFGQKMNVFPGEHKKEATESSTVITYDLQLKEKNVILREVELRSQYVFAPLNKDQKQMITFVNNKLTLIEESNNVKAVRDVENVQSEKQSLVYSAEQEEKMELFRMTGEEKHLNRVSFPWMEKKVEIARRIAKEIRELLAKDDAKDLQPEITHELARFVEVLRMMTKEEILKIAPEMEKNTQLFTLFADQLAIAGTKNTIEYLYEKIAERKINNIHAHKLIKSIAFTRNPSDKIVQLTIELLEKVEDMKDEPLRQNIALTLGSLMNGVCGDHKDSLALNLRDESAVCPRQLKNKYVKDLKKRFDAASTRYEKVLAVKMMANSGMDLIVFPLEEIIRDERQEKTVRVEAIDALRKLRTVMPRKIHNILLPLYKNNRIAPEIRVAAFHQIMATQPHRMVIDQIVEQLNRETSRQVYSFVYSTLKAYARSELPLEKELSRDIEMSLKLNNAQTPRKMLDSTYTRASMWSEDLKTGSALNTAVLFTSDSVLPKELMASLDTIFAGEWTKYFAQIGFTQHNMDKVLFKLVEKVEKRLPALRATRGQTKPSEALRQLMEKMNIKNRREAFESEESHALVYLRYKDMDVAVFPIDETIIDELADKFVSEGKIRLAEIRRVLEKGIDFNTAVYSFVYERTRIIPTTFGFPLEITSKLPTIVKMEGSIKAEYKHGKALISLKAQPEIISTHVSHMEVRSPVLSNGVRVIITANARLPIDATLEVEYKDQLEAKLTMRAPETTDKKRILMAHSRPVTYIRHENNHHKWHAAQEKTVLFAEKARKQFNYDLVDKQFFGVKYAVRGDFHREMFEKLYGEQTLPALITENHVEIVMEKTDDDVKEYVIKMTAEPVEWTEKKMTMPEMKAFYDKETKEYMTVEDSEYVNEDEEERRDVYGKYVEKKSSKKESVLSHRVNVELFTVGGEKRRMSADLKTECTKDISICQWQLEALRTPLGEERKEWTLKAKLYTIQPETIQTLTQLHNQKHREMNALFEARWGSDETNKMTIKMQAEQSAEQQKWQKVTLEKKSDDLKTLESLELLNAAARLNQVKLVVEYDIVPETQHKIAFLSALLKASKPLTVSVEPRRLEKSFERSGRLNIKMTVEPKNWRYANVLLETASEKVELMNLRLPFRPTFLTLSALPKSTIEYTESPVCEVASQRVRTFDDVIYRAPLTTCFSVLAKDCSESPKFVVMMKKVNDKSEDKIVKIMTEDYEIEMKPKNEEEFIVKVDGKNIKESEYEQYKIESVESVIIFKNKHVIVRFDGEKVKIEMSKVFKNKQCGMCGHYDDEVEGEFRRADNEYTDDLEEFHRSFLVKDSECEVEESKLSKKTNYNKYEKESMKSLFDDESSSSEEDKEESNEWENKQEKNTRRSYNKYDDEEDRETVEPIEKVRVMEFTSRVCFSLERLPECARNTAMDETKEIKAKFTCLSRSNDNTRAFLRKVERNDESLLKELQEMSVDYTETIRVPKACSVY